MSQTLEELRAARKARDAARKADADIQECKDELVREELEKTLGVVYGVRLDYRPGLPVIVFVRCPSSVEYQRLSDQLAKQKDKSSNEPLELLGRTCIVHPKEKEQQAKLFDHFPGLPVMLGLTATKAAEGAREEEGKE